MINFLFGLLLGHVFGYGVFTMVDKIDRELKANDDQR